jgi:hypothetical protein
MFALIFCAPDVIETAPLATIESFSQKTGTGPLAVDTSKLADTKMFAVAEPGAKWNVGALKEAALNCIGWLGYFFWRSGNIGASESVFKNMNTSLGK